MTRRRLNLDAFPRRTLGSKSRSTRSCPSRRCSSSNRHWGPRRPLRRVALRDRGRVRRVRLDSNRFLSAQQSGPGPSAETLGRILVRNTTAASLIDTATSRGPTRTTETTKATVRSRKRRSTRFHLGDLRSAPSIAASGQIPARPLLLLATSETCVGPCSNGGRRSLSSRRLLRGPCRLRSRSRRRLEHLRPLHIARDGRSRWPKRSG